MPNPDIEIQLKLFAALREQIGIDTLTLSIPDGSSVAALIEHLIEQSSNWQPLRQAAVLVAVNQTMATSATTLGAGDEVALFPPVTGG